MARRKKAKNPVAQAGALLRGAASAGEASKLPSASNPDYALPGPTPDTASGFRKGGLVHRGRSPIQKRGF